MPDDRIQREIEDILSKIDDFPAERARRRRRRTLANVGEALHQSLIAPLARVSMGQIMLASLAIVVLALVLMSISPVLGRWLIIGGLILFFTSFALSALGRGPRGRPKVTKYWRDRPLELEEPTLFDRVRAWFSRRPPRY